MEFSLKLIIGLFIGVFVIGTGLAVTIFYHPLQLSAPWSSGPEVNIPGPMIKPAEDLTGIISINKAIKAHPDRGERIAVLFAGEEIFTDKTKEERAGRIFIEAAARDPSMAPFTPAEASDSIRQTMQNVAIAISQSSAIDLVCVSILNDGASCGNIERDINRSREAFPAFQSWFSKSGLSCESIRASWPAKNWKCDGATSTRGYLCKGVNSGDCLETYRSLVEDFTYMGLAFSSGDNRFCELVEDPEAKTGCLAGDRETGRKMLQTPLI